MGWSPQRPAEPASRFNEAHDVKVSVPLSSSLSASASISSQCSSTSSRALRRQAHLVSSSTLKRDTMSSTFT